LGDGDVQIDGVDPVFMLQDPKQIFFRAFRHADYDICELSLSSDSVKTAAGTSPYIAIPVFPPRGPAYVDLRARGSRD
jgi:4,5-dihydroxyphthalate decarboxylase